MDPFILQYEEEKYHYSGFWKKVDSTKCIPDAGVIFSGLLTIKVKPGQWKSAQFKLTSEFLYQFKVRSTQTKTAQAKRLTAVRWKRVDPFTEENDSDVRYGFRLMRGRCYQDFYVDSPETLENWLDQLSKVAIMSDIENDFEVGEEIGRGNYAQVRLGRSVTDHSLVAIKIISKEGIMKSSRNVQALINEISIMKSLSHPRIVKMLGMYESETELQLILEYVGGGDLFQRLIKKGKYSEAKTAIFMKHLLEVLDYLHEHNVVHRDLKPENILLMSGTDGVEFKIADFGLASEYHCGEALTLRCGSPGYVAPEILDKHGYNDKVDVFSAGIIMYIL